jgi:hypothetical protein
MSCFDETSIPSECPTFLPIQRLEQTSVRSAVRKRLSNDEWESLKPLIQRLYIDENRTFSYVANVLRAEHQFFPT